jgi:hypothetical protein
MPMWPIGSPHQYHHRLLGRAPARRAHSSRRDGGFRTCLRAASGATVEQLVEASRHYHPGDDEDAAGSRLFGPLQPPRERVRGPGGLSHSRWYRGSRRAVVGIGGRR